MCIRKSSVAVVSFVAGLVMSATAATTHTWTGAVSSDWSEPLNWEGGAPQNGGDVTLTGTGTYLPTNQDIDELTINTLTLGVGYPDNQFVLSGLPLRVKKSVVAGGTSEAPMTYRIENDLTLDASSVTFTVPGDNKRTWMSRLYLDGDVKDNGSNVPVQITSSGQGVTYLAGQKSFRGTTYPGTGLIAFYSDASLGALPSEPEEKSIGNNSGSNYAALDPTKPYSHIVINPLRLIYNNKGSFLLDPGVDLTYDGSITSAENFQLAQIVQGDSPSIVYLGGNSPSINNLRVQAGVILIPTVSTAFGTTAIHVQYGALDFNGFDFSNPLDSHSNGLNSMYSLYVNNNTTRTTTLSGLVTIGPQNASSYFGGLGDIVVAGNVADGNTSRATIIWKASPGKLTFSGETLDWNSTATAKNGMVFAGGGAVVLDHRAYNTPKLYVADNNVVQLGGSELHLIGHASESTTETINNFSLVDGSRHAGASRIRVTAGDADATLVVNQITFDAAGTLDFVCASSGAGKARVQFPNNDNDSEFVGFQAGYTWNGGETFAKLDSDHFVVPMPDSDYVTEYTADKVWDVAAGPVELAKGGTVYSCRFNKSAGTTLTIGAGKVLKFKSKVSKPVGFLLTPSSGNVTLTGGELCLNNYSNPMHFQVFNPSAKLRIESLINNNGREHYNNRITATGPGEVELVNDANCFGGVVSLYLGSTLSFTSAANINEISALGTGYDESGTIRLGRDSTLNYIGTAAAGHSTDRPVRLAGNAKIAANGVGKLHLTAAKAVEADWVGCYQLTLSGSGEGEIDGALKPGWLGCVVKTGSGTWTLNSSAHEFFYPFEVKEGTLVVNGAIPSDVNVSAGATLASETGCTLKRNVSLAGTLLCNPAAESPVKVLGTVTLGGELKLAGKAREAVDLLVADGGITGEFASVPANVKVVYSANAVRVEPISGMMIIVR